MKRIAIHVAALAAVLCLAGSALAGGVAPPKHQLAERQRRMFRNTPDRQVARFLAHPYQPTANAAAAELASRGDKVAPLMIALLKDNVAEIRSGAVTAMAKLYHHDGETFRTKVDNPALAKVLDAIAPLIDDPDNDVRRAVINFVTSVRVDSPATRGILAKIAKTPDVGTLAGIQSILRNQIQDPDLRVELARISAETLMEMDNPNPGSLKVLPISSTAHVEACEPLIPACVRLLDTHALTLWGMFSDSPTQAAMQILERFPTDPRVVKALPSILRFYTRKFGGKNGYWIHVQEGPRRITLRMGPKALPALKAFIPAERELFKRYASGAATPANAWSKLSTGHKLRFEELDDVAAMIRALHGPMPAADAVPLMCRVYLQRDWSEDERQMIRDRLVALGPQAASLVRQQLPSLTELATKRVSGLIAKWRKTEEATNVRSLTKLIQAMEGHLGQIESYATELADAATLIETVAGKPTPERARTLCKLYVRRGWVPQRTLIRNTLLKWGPRTVKAVRQFPKADRPYYQECIAKLAEAEVHSRATLRFGRGLDGALIRHDLDRAELADTYAALGELATVIEAAGQAKPSVATVAELCRIYARRGWPRHRRAIKPVLARTDAAETIRAQIKLAEADLAEAVEMKHMCLANTVKSRYRWRYDIARTTEANLRAGIAGLQKLAAGK